MSTADQVGVKVGVKSDLARPAVAYAEGQKGKFVAKSLVPEVGFEPTRGFPHRFLSLTTPVISASAYYHQRSFLRHTLAVEQTRMDVNGMSVGISEFKAKLVSKKVSDFRGLGWCLLVSGGVSVSCWL